MTCYVGVIRQQAINGSLGDVLCWVIKQQQSISDSLGDVLYRVIRQQSINDSLNEVSYMHACMQDKK